MNEEIDKNEGEAEESMKDDDPNRQTPYLLEQSLNLKMSEEDIWLYYVTRYRMTLRYRN